MGDFSMVYVVPEASEKKKQVACETPVEKLE